MFGIHYCLLFLLPHHLSRLEGFQLHLGYVKLGAEAVLVVVGRTAVNGGCQRGDSTCGHQSLRGHDHQILPDFAEDSPETPVV